MEAPAASNILSAAAVISGPMPSPGIKVIFVLIINLPIVF
jgi:hypothetical protein